LAEYATSSYSFKNCRYYLHLNPAVPLAMITKGVSRTALGLENLGQWLRKLRAEDIIEQAAKPSCETKAFSMSLGTWRQRGCNESQTLQKRTMLED
jgi:hypothetical protein